MGLDIFYDRSTYTIIQGKLTELRAQNRIGQERFEEDGKINGTVKHNLSWMGAVVTQSSYWPLTPKGGLSNFISW